jgi:hypothetical protein
MAGGHVGHERGDRRGDVAPPVHKEGLGQGVGQLEPTGEVGVVVLVRHGGWPAKDPTQHPVDHGCEPGAHSAD